MVQQLRWTQRQGGAIIHLLPALRDDSNKCLHDRGLFKETMSHTIEMIPCSPTAHAHSSRAGAKAEGLEDAAFNLCGLRRHRLEPRFDGRRQCAL